MQPATMYHGGRLCPGLLLNLSSAADRELLWAARALLWWAAQRHPRRNEIVIFQ